MKMDNKAILEKYAENLSHSDKAKELLKYADDFLGGAESLDKAAVESYITRLRRRGRSPGTVNWVFRIIRRLYVVNGIPWEFRRGEAPQIGQRDEYRPQLSADVIHMVVQATLESDDLGPAERAFVALSTVYGLRREELTNLEQSDIDLDNNSIYIATVKFGRERYHIIPPEIWGPLAAYDFDTTVSTSGLSIMFKKILVAAGARELKKYKLGWHSIRRALYDGLVNNGVNPLAARVFMRWKAATGDLAMPARYYGNMVIGLNNEQPVLEEAKGDAEIFEKHPFLPFWRE